jgi:hypothetical protein
MNAFRFFLFAAAMLAATLFVSSCGKAPGHSPPADIRHYAVAISPALSRVQREEVWKNIGEMVLEKIAPGDTLVVYDALARKQIARFDVPRTALMQSNPNARARRLATPLAEVKNFLAIEPGAAEASGAILEPQIVRLAAEKTSGRPLAIVLVGSPLYRHPSDPAWSFDGGRYPSDGHLLADPVASPFSVRGAETALAGVTIHHDFPDGGVFETASYEASVKRWWSLWVSAQKGRLCSFSPDLRSTFAAAVQGASQPVLAAAASAKDDKVEMHTTQRSHLDPGDINWILRTREELEKEVRDAPPLASSLVQSLKLMIRWSAPVDFDLYFLPRPGAEELFFGRSLTSEGIHAKDYLDAPPGVQGFETIEMKVPVDVKGALASINLYRGEVPAGTEVEIRIIADGRLFLHRAVFPAVSGTRGAVTRRSEDKAWVLFDLTRIMGLTEPGRVSPNHP